METPGILFVTPGGKHRPIVGGPRVHGSASAFGAVPTRVLRAQGVAQHHAAHQHVADVARVLVAALVQQVVQ